MGQEIERKFLLLKPIPQSVFGRVSAVRVCSIWQGYLPVTVGELRIRSAVFKNYPDLDTCTLTSKNGEGLIREEMEVKIPRAIFDQMEPLVRDSFLKKKRYSVPFGKYLLELDKYQDALGGLYIMECEFSSVEDAKEFVLPVWAASAVDITEDNKFKNKNLARKNITTELLLGRKY